MYPLCWYALAPTEGLTHRVIGEYPVVGDEVVVTVLICSSCFKRVVTRIYLSTLRVRISSYRGADAPGHTKLGAIHILRKKYSGWVGLQNAYNYLFPLCN